MSDVNTTPQKNSEAEALESLFNTYKERNEKKKKFSKDELLQKYFTPSKDLELFRALPRVGEEKLIEEGYFHKIKDGRKPWANVTVYCPAKNNPKVQAKDKVTGEPVVDQQGKPVMVNEYCPLCAKGYSFKNKTDKNIYSTTKDKKKEELTAQEKAVLDKNKELLKAGGEWEAKLYYIIRGIDRNAEGKGVKFWRFKQNYKNQGVHDKLKPVIDTQYKINGRVFTDPTNGFDLIISCVTNTTNNGAEYRDVSSIMARDPSLLHTDELVRKGWLEDKTVWRDVFKPKKAPGITELRYLELAAEGNTPYYNEEIKRWIFPNHPDLEEAANTRNRNLDANQDEDYGNDPEDVTTGSGFAGAINTINNQAAAPDINNMSTVLNNAPGNFNHGSEEISAGKKNEVATSPAGTGGAPTPKSPYDDLPF